MERECWLVFAVSLTTTTQPISISLIKMARTKQTAKKSTGGKPVRTELAVKAKRAVAQRMRFVNGGGDVPPEQRALSYVHGAPVPMGGNMYKTTYVIPFQFPDDTPGYLNAHAVYAWHKDTISKLKLHNTPAAKTPKGNFTKAAKKEWSDAYQARAKEIQHGDEYQGTIIIFHTQLFHYIYFVITNRRAEKFWKWRAEAKVERQLL
jgi:hypothetical protein